MNADPPPKKKIRTEPNRTAQTHQSKRASPFMFLRKSGSIDYDDHGGGGDDERHRRRHQSNRHPSNRTPIVDHDNDSPRLRRISSEGGDLSPSSSGMYIPSKQHTKRRGALAGDGAMSLMRAGRDRILSTSLPIHKSRSNGGIGEEGGGGGGGEGSYDVKKVSPSSEVSASSSRRSKQERTRNKHCSAPWSTVPITDSPPHSLQSSPILCT